jgi:hypothetical protein
MPSDMGSTIKSKLAIGGNDYLYIAAYDSSHRDGFLRFEPSTTTFIGPVMTQVKTVYLDTSCGSSRTDNGSCGVIKLPTEHEFEKTSIETLNQSLSETQFKPSQYLTPLDSLSRDPNQQPFSDGTMWLVRRETIEVQPGVDPVWVQTIAVKIDKLDLTAKTVDFSYKVLEYRKK